MTTPNEELILKLRGQAYTTCRPDQLCDQAADLLQSQAERIKELIDSVNFKHSKITELENERDTLRAELAEIEKQEPVAWRGRCTDPLHDWCLFYRRQESQEKFLNMEWQPLFTRPMPAQDVTELVDAAYDKVQRLIVDRYHVEKSIGGFWPSCVKAGDGNMDVFVGSTKQAENVRQALQTACLDGAFIASQKAKEQYKDYDQQCAAQARELALSEVNKITSERDELREKYTDTYWALNDAARENTSLRAQLAESISNHEACKSANTMLLDEIAAIAATEPVATLVVEWVFHEYDNSAKEDRAGYVSTSFHRTAAAEKMPIGKYALFTRPMPAQDVTELVEALQPFVLANSSEEYMTLVVCTADITKARTAIANAKGAK